MLPSNNDIELDDSILEEDVEPSLTWKLDFKAGKITGMIDGMEAIKQSVFHILNTERYEHLIYSFDYGSELKGLIGLSPIFIESELNRRVEEALQQDDRITGIDNFSMTRSEDKALVTFTVISELGNFKYEQEVQLDGGE